MAGSIIRYPFHGKDAMVQVCDFVRTFPLQNRHVLDISWRISAPIINEGRDGAFWQDTQGRIVGFAAWQYYWAALDFFILPGPTEQEVEAAIFAWAEERMHERDVERGYPLSYCVEFRDDDDTRRQLVEAHGFLLEADDSYVLFQHTLDTLAQIPALPDGFTLRPLRGVEEVAAYAELHRAAFESTSMTPEWRARTLQTPQYRPELDLVISAPDGSLVGFCVGWFDADHQAGQIEPLGVHPHFHQYGFGRVLLLEMLRRFKEQGARRAFVETNLSFIPALRAYEAVGFQQVHTIRRKGKWANLHEQ
ncbi:GNAT family N-acetyltransferase [Tengunoibacter tsumagoiensis]|uniref:N-acetyltransferase domain-containing protein n=1 Tax=Tengunoibacter tsumagoiensis TaxID=2014871 RepID=A0A402A8Y9_9CHLR|nr:N-acetyltransferase [Tengunoibacter tsumagoiensis]GCE15637.1 hypothetical protein KTT_54960 [Tengunoibacter tsumagoiensis]